MIEENETGVLSKFECFIIAVALNIFVVLVVLRLHGVI